MFVTAAIPLIAAFLPASGQSSWVEPLAYDGNDLSDEPVCGVMYAENSPDGAVYFLAKQVPDI
jgi:hypothetical protein